MAIPASLQALLSNLIDYAGLYPPAALPLHDMSEKYAAYRASPDSWILNRVVLPLPKLAEAPVGEGWRITLLVDGEPGPLPPQVETLETKLSHGLSLTTYCEAPIDQVTGAFAKVRTSGLTPDAIPSASHCRFSAKRRAPPSAIQSYRRTAPPHPIPSPVDVRAR